MGLEEDLAQKISKELAQEIDNELLADIYVAYGWTKVENQFYYNAKHAVDISYWIANHCQGKATRIGRHWLFELEKDATMYILRWA